jgi:aminotransferase
MDSQTLDGIVEIANKKRVTILSDEVYGPISFVKTKSILEYDGLHSHVLSNGFSKMFTMTGWRIGWAVAAENLSNSIRKVHDYLTIGAPTPLQEALVTALSFPASYYDQLARMYEQKRDQMLTILDEAEFEYFRPEGAYYILAEAPSEFNDDLDYANYLIKTVGVAALPASALYHDKELGRRKIRFAYCKRDATLEEVGKRLCKLKPRQHSNI